MLITGIKGKQSVSNLKKTKRNWTNGIDMKISQTKERKMLFSMAAELRKSDKKESPWCV